MSCSTRFFRGRWTVWWLMAMAVTAFAVQAEPPQPSTPSVASRSPQPPSDPPKTDDPRPTEGLLATLPAPRRALLAEVFDHNPTIARARARAAALHARTPQARAWPDPTLGATLFVLPPETRVGAQRLGVSWSQGIPWLAKLDQQERAAVLAALAADQAVEVERLTVFAEASRLHDELWFLDRQEGLLLEEREHLIRHEEAALARYTAGKGLQQGVLKIQAEITRVERHRLDIQVQVHRLEAALNGLRDQPFDDPVARSAPREPRRFDSWSDALVSLAETRRPEMRRAQLTVEHHRVLEELALVDLKPDFQVGVRYTLVTGRDDPVGRAAPPPDDGDDILALSGSLRLPRRKPRVAAQEEAAHQRRMAEEDLRRVRVQIVNHVGDLATRLPLLYDQWHLLTTVLLAQAEEALRSAESAYATGEIGALDLLDAEHVLFQVRTAAARVRSDYSIAATALAVAIAGPEPFHTLFDAEESTDDR